MGILEELWSDMVCSLVKSVFFT